MAGRETPHAPAAPTIEQILDGYRRDREPRVHSDSIRFDCATLKKHLGDLPADLLGSEQVRAYMASGGGTVPGARQPLIGHLDGSFRTAR